MKSFLSWLNMPIVFLTMLQVWKQLLSISRHLITYLSWHCWEITHESLNWKDALCKGWRKDSIFLRNGAISQGGKIFVFLLFFYQFGQLQELSKMVLMTNGSSHGRLSLVFKKTNMQLHVYKSVSFSIFITWLIFYNPFFSKLSGKFGPF